MAAGFLLGILVAAYCTHGILFTAVAGTFLALVCQTRKAFVERESETGRKKRLFRLWLCMLAFILGGGKYLWEEQFRAAYLPFLENGMLLTVQGELTGKQVNNHQYIYELKSCMIEPDQSKCSSQKSVLCNRILLYSDADIYSIGQILVVDGTVELWESASKEGGFDAAAFYEARKIDFKLQDISIHAAYGKPDSIAERLWQLRLRLKAVYQETMRVQEAGIMTTMVAGDKELLDAETKRLYQSGGLTHILAISGLHISLIGMTLYRILRKGGLGFTGAGILAGTMMYGYGTMVGLSVSVQRSVGMFLLFLAAQIIGRSYDTLNALGAVAVFLLWKNPYLLWDAGFQFSFVAILGVVWVGGSMVFTQEGQGKWKKKLYVSGAIQLATLPLAAWYYYEIPLYAVVVNLVVLPFVGVLLGVGIAGGVLGLISLRVAGMLLIPCQVLLGLCSRLCGIVAKFPGAMWITGRPGISRMLLYYGVLALFTVCAYRRGQRERNTGNGRTGTADWETKRTEMSAAEGKRVRGQEIGLLALGALLLGILTVPQKAEFELAVLDVGQGDGDFLRTKEGYSVFVDGGSSNVGKVGEYRILPFLKYKGVHKIDCWVVSHTDEDHISGLKEILRAGYPVRFLVFSEEIVRDAAWEELTSLAKEAGTKVIYLNGGDVLYFGDAKLTAIYPVGEENGREKGESAAEDNADKNAASLVVLYEEDGFSGIFTGDIGSEQERQIVELLRERDDGCVESIPVDFYKAAHHGSKYSNSEEFLEVLAPQISVISCSVTNRYGHPSVEAIEHMEDSGSSVFYTMESGQITIKLEDGMKVYEFRGEESTN